jgi:integrase
MNKPEGPRDVNAPNERNELNERTRQPQFVKARDGRKQPVRGLWVASASGKFYAQIAVEEYCKNGKKKQRRVLLLDSDKKPVPTVAEAVKALARLKDQQEKGELPTLTRTPKFGEFLKTYLGWIKAGEGRKAPGTIEKEESLLEKWEESLGDLRLDQIRQSHVNAFVQKRLEAGVCGRTADLDVMALRCILNHAIDEGWIKSLPLPRTRRNKSRKGATMAPKRELFDPADLDALCAAALANKESGEPVTKNGRQLCDYLKLMAYSGMRRNEALGVKWSDVDFDAGLLHVRRQVTSRGIEEPKSGVGRSVNFNSKLEAHLKDMHERRAPDLGWLFPSPQRGDKDIPAHSFRESMELARRHVIADHPRLARKAFHDLRHYFISYCVMSGIDFMTIASWVGHADGGVLIGRVYGHLADSHKAAAALRVNFGPEVMEKVEEQKGAAA